MYLDLTVSDLFNEFQALGVLSELHVDTSTKITGISAVEDAQPGDLVFMDKKDYLSSVASRRPAAVVTSPKLRDLVAEIQGVAVLVAPQVGLAHALIKQRYRARRFEDSGWEGVHPSAVVHETATIGAGTVVEPRAIIGKNSRIGAGCRVMAGVVIENDVTIGDGSILHPGVIIGYGSQLGREVEIESGTVIGSQGFGFAQDAKRKSHAIPQTGIVVLGDRVRIGANCCVDRAAYSETRIGSGTKIDNLSHVAHNVQIGEDCLLTAFFCVAGSTTIGNRVIASGQTGILDHKKICDDVILLHRAGVTKDIEAPGPYAGLPTQPLGDYMKNLAALREAAELRKILMSLVGDNPSSNEAPST